MKMENKELLEKVSKLGFPLFEVEEKFDVNQTLAEVVRSRQARLFEGFAVLLVNASQDDGFNLERVQNALNSENDKNLLRELLFLSLGLYKYFNYYFSWANNFYKMLPEEERNKVREFRNYFVHNMDFNVMGYTFSSERLKEVFTSYLKNEVEKVKKQTAKQEDFSLEIHFKVQ